MFAFTFAFLVVLAFLRVALVTGGIVVRSSTLVSSSLSPSVQYCHSSATILARVDVCRDRVGSAGRAISFLDLVFAFALSLAFLERVDLHTVIICARSISS